jgi:hypothetical protein
VWAEAELDKGAAFSFILEASQSTEIQPIELQPIEVQLAQVQPIEVQSIEVTNRAVAAGGQI